MLQFTLKLYSKIQRPTFDIHCDKIVAMLDTGALYPIWTKSEELLIKLLKAEYTGKNVPVSGFGGTTTGKVYIIPLLQVGKINYTNMHIVVSDNLGKVPFSIILSATMFQGLIYEIDTVNNCFNVTIPNNESSIRNYKVIDSMGQINILCQSVEETETKQFNKALTKEDINANYINKLIKNSK